MKLDVLDEILLLSEGKRRSLDCVVILDFANPPSLEKLKEGATRAQKIFPKTSAYEVSLSIENQLEDFINRPLKSIWHLEEAIIGNSVAFKMSHAVGDAVSMILWLKAQFGHEISDEKLLLHKFPEKRNSPYTGIRPSIVWPYDKNISSIRKTEEITLQHDERYVDFSINDLLSLAVLKSLPVERKALWLPVNVRKNSWSGFGNGLSRMRIYPSPEALSVKDELNFIRQQKRDAWKNGELFLPEDNFNLNAVKKLLLKGFIKRPWADWGSLALSHINDKTDIFPEALRIRGITNIPEKHQAGLFAFTGRGETSLTLAIDAVNKDETGRELLKQIKYHFDLLKKEA